MIWACSPEFFEHRRQLRKLKPRPAGRLANAWHSFVNFSWYCILNDASTDNVIEQVPDEAAVIDTSHEPSVVTTRSILMAMQASNSSGLQQSNSLRKRRSSSILSSLLPKSSVAPLVLPTPSQSSSSPPLPLSSSSSTPPSSVSSSSTTTPSSTPPSSSGNLYRKRLNNTESKSSTATCGHASTEDEDMPVVQSEKLNTTADIETDMSINIACDDHIRQVPGGTIPDTDRLIKRTLDWGMSSASTSSTTPSSVVPTSSTNLTRVKQNKNEEDLKDHGKWDESIVNVEVLLGLKKPKNEQEAAAQKRELGNETPYWKIDESRDKESADSASRDVEESRDDGVDSGVESRNVSRTV